MHNPYSFERVAGIYDATRGWPPAVAEAIGAELYKLLAPLAARGPVRVVEVGAGTGRVLAPLAAQGATAVGVDISPAMLQLLRDKQPQGPGAGWLAVVLAAAQQLPFPAAAFDIGLFVHILHLVPDWQAVLAEVQRVVRPAGALVFGLDRQEAGEQGWIDARWQALLEEAGDGSPQHGRREVAVEEATAKLVPLGYTIEQYTLARWTETRPLTDTLERVRGRYFSSSWDIPDSVLEPAVAQLTAELVARYGDLNQSFSRARWFEVMIAHRP